MLNKLSKEHDISGHKWSTTHRMIKSHKSKMNWALFYASTGKCNSRGFCSSCNVAGSWKDIFFKLLWPIYIYLNAVICLYKLHLTTSTFIWLISVPLIALSTPNITSSYSPMKQVRLDWTPIPQWNRSD